MRRISVLVGRGGSFRCLGMLKVLEIGADVSFEPGGFRKLFFQLSDESRHLFLEGVAVAFHCLGADVAAGRKDISMRRDFFCRR